MFGLILISVTVALEEGTCLRPFLALLKTALGLGVLQSSELVSAEMRKSETAF